MKRNFPDKTLASLQEVLDSSPADFTEIAWVEKWWRTIGDQLRGPELPEATAGTVFIRVQEGGRVGHHRTDTQGSPHLSNAVRCALALARSKAPTTIRLNPSVPQDLVSEASLYDPMLAEISREPSQNRFKEILEGGERGQLQVFEAQVLVVNSVGLRCQARTTTATLSFTSGRGIGGGTARSCARTLEGLRIDETLAQARGNRSSGPGVALPADLRALPLVFSPEASTVLLEELTTLTLQPRGPESTFLEARGGHPLFGPAMDLVDDGTDPSGLPFPFDLQGTPKSPLWIVRGGCVQPLPWLPPEQPDRRTSLAAGGGEVRFSNLNLPPGQVSQEELLDAADGGLWIGSLRRRSYGGPETMSCRFRVRGARRIVGGRRDSPVEEGCAEFDLLDLFSRLRLRGNAMGRRPFGDGVFGGVTAPGLLFAAGS